MSDQSYLLNREPVESPLITSIAEQKCNFKFIGKEGGESRVRTVDGNQWHGTEYMYSIHVPGGKPSGEDWDTELVVWTPLPLFRKYWIETPGTKIFIHAGDKGEMTLTNKEDQIELVRNEIRRQLENASELR